MSTAGDAADAMRGARRTPPPWFVIAVLCAVSVASALQYMLLVPLVPILPTQLDTTPNEISWLVTSSILAGTIASPIFARLADMYGRRLMLFVCLGCIVVGSLVGLLTANIWVLVAARSLSGLANAAVPIGIAILRAELPPERRALGIGLVSTTGTVGVGLALPIAGALNAWFGWHSIFVFMLVLAAILMALLPFAVLRGGARVEGRFDGVGAGLLAIGLLALLLGISKGVDWGWLSPPVLGLVGLAIVLGAIWFWHERRTKTPVVDLRISATPTVVLTNALSLLIGFTVFGNILVMTSQLQLPDDAGGFGLSAVAASGLLSIPAFTIALAAPGASVLVQRMGGRNLLLIGGVCTLIGYAVRWLLPGSLLAIVLGAIVIQLGSSACLAAVPVIITAHAPLAETASANGLNVLIRSIGSTFSSATVAAAFTLTAVSPSGAVYPSPAAFGIFFAIASCCGLATGAGAIWLPRPRLAASQTAADPVS